MWLLGWNFRILAYRNVSPRSPRASNLNWMHFPVLLQWNDRAGRAYCLKGGTYGTLHQRHQIDGRLALARLAGHLLRGKPNHQGAAQDDRAGDQPRPCGGPTSAS